jgi:hypothetical protein
MSASRRLPALVALASFTAAAVAGWFSISPAAERPRAISVIPAKVDEPAAKSPPVNPSRTAALDAAERNLLMELDPSTERCSGKRLLELCLEDETDQAGHAAAFLYAQRWARQSPQEMFDWFQQHGGFEVRAEPRGSSRYNFDAVLFAEWAKRDPAAALWAALACHQKRDRGTAVVNIVRTLHETDPRRAFAIMAEHTEFFRSGDLPSAQSANYRATWDTLTTLPAGKDRNIILARYFDDLWKYRREDSGRLWQEMPASLRDELVAGSFAGAVAIQQGELVPQHIPELEGMDELRRRHVETTGDTAAAAHYINSRNGREWALRDPAAAIAWAQEHLKGEQRVRSTASLFHAGAAGNFEATLRLWQSLPEGVFRARAAGNLAAGAPAERKAEVEALMAAMSETDRRIADLAEHTASSNEVHRVIREGQIRKAQQQAEQ